MPVYIAAFSLVLHLYIRKPRLERGLLEAAAERLCADQYARETAE